MHCKPLQRNIKTSTNPNDIKTREPSGINVLLGSLFIYEKEIRNEDQHETRQNYYSTSPGT